MGKLDLDFKILISDLQSNAKSENDYNAEISGLIPFDRSIGKSEKGFEKLSLRTAVRHVYA